MVLGQLLKGEEMLVVKNNLCRGWNQFLQENITALIVLKQGIGKSPLGHKPFLFLVNSL